MKTGTVDSVLNEVTIKQLAFKSVVMRKIACIILESFLARPMLYTDEIDLSWVRDEDANAIGSTFRMLGMLELITKTGSYRRSKTKSRRGGLCWEYIMQDYNRHLAKTFLSRNSDTKPVGQQSLL